MDIRIQVRNVFGSNRAYPRCRTASLFASIAGTETLTARTLKMVQQLGYKIIVEPTDLGEVV